jgi:hypothetical protein
MIRAIALLRNWIRRASWSFRCSRAMRRIFFSFRCSKMVSIHCGGPSRHRPKPADCCRPPTGASKPLSDICPLESGRLAVFDDAVEVEDVLAVYAPGGRRVSNSAWDRSPGSPFTHRPAHTVTIGYVIPIPFYASPFFYPKLSISTFKQSTRSH